MEGGIRLCCVADVDRRVLAHLRQRLAPIFGRHVHCGGRLELVPEEFHAGRRQYQATSILRRLRSLRPEGALLLAVTEIDLFAAGLNFVFGEADRRGRCAIISLARLRGACPDRPFAPPLLRRALIEAVHEVGHLQGLEHCPLPTCVMHFSVVLSDTDRKRPEFCRCCRELLP